MKHKENVFSLNYSRTKITNIPKEVFKFKDTLIELDISGNNFKDFLSVLEDLKKLTKLKKLKINIYTQEQAKTLIDSMPNLEYLNDELIDEDSDEEIIINEFSNKNEDGEILINIPLIKLVDKTFEPVFKKLQEFYKMNETKEDDFQNIIKDFNNLGRKIKISENDNLENLNLNEIKKKLELYKFLFNKLNKIKKEINNTNNKYNQNSIKLFLNIIQINDKIKNNLNKLLLNHQSIEKSKINKNNNNIKSPKKNLINELDNSYKYYTQEPLQEEKNNLNLNHQNPQNNRNIFNKFPLASKKHDLKNLILMPDFNENNKNNINELLKKNKSFNKICDKVNSPINSGYRTQNASNTEKKKTIRRYIYDKAKKRSKQLNLIENFINPNLNYLLMKPKTQYNTSNIFEDENNNLIYKNKLNIKIINLNTLLEIINQVYKIRNSRIEKMKHGFYSKSTLEQDLYTYLKSKYGLKKIIIEWNINILSSIQSYIKLNSEVYLFCLILRNELDEDSIIILNKIKKTVNNILNIIYDYDINTIKNIKNNKEFIKENEWINISKCLYCDDDNLRTKFINKVSNYIDNLIKGEDLIAITGRKILYNDFLDILIRFNLKLRKDYLHNLFLLFSEQDKNRTGIINLEGFRNIINNCGIIKDEQKRKEVFDDLIEIADKEGSGQITFNDIVQCFDNLDLITDEGRVKFLDKLSNMNFNECK